jgi:hypothetical protein
LICERKAFPSPCPAAAPFTNPAMSVMLRKAGTLLQIYIQIKKHAKDQDKYFLQVYGLSTNKSIKTEISHFGFRLTTEQ